MKKILLFALAAFCCSAALGQTLRYNRPASYFEEALVIGNGTMGGIIYGDTRTDRISTTSRYGRASRAT